MKSNEADDPTRRGFFRSAVVGGSMLVVGGCNAWQTRSGTSEHEHGSGRKEEEGEGVSAPEDLMREHGVLDRILLVYEECDRRLAAGADFDPAVLSHSAKLVRSFIEEYHEKLEEDHLFPRFERAGRLVDLVELLRTQHRAGRRVTEVILAQSAVESKAPDPETLRAAIRAFIRMYRPHAAREDTVLFPALHDIVSAAEIAEMGERFEEIENDRFGEGGFEGVVDEVAGIERELGIHDLAQFTP